MSDTPRTDAEQYDELLRLRGICSDGEPCVVPAGFARDLEREIAELRKQLTFVEAFADPPDTNTSKTTRDELRNQLEQAEARCKNLWEEIARLHGIREASCEATSPASTATTPTTEKPA